MHPVRLPGRPGAVDAEAASGTKPAPGAPKAAEARILAFWHFRSMGPVPKRNQQVFICNIRKKGAFQ